MGKKVLKLFLETMLRAVVIILGIGIIIVGALLIKTLVDNNSLKESKVTEDGSEIVTEADDEDDLTFKSSSSDEEGSSDDESTTGVSSLDANILVINATGTSGVAGSWKTTLESLGYTSVEVGNYLAGTLSTTKICVSGDYDGSDLASSFTSPETDTIDSLTSSDFDMTISDYDIVIVVGTADVQN